jgi:SAM-dependent methyltransferase
MVDRLFSDADLAALYDPWCPRSERDDFDFYLPMVMAARAVLDVGCGTGAMLHEARQAGHVGRLCGLDPARGMLAQARKRRDVEWVLGDLTTVAWRDAFDLVVMTGHAFQVLVDDDDIRAALAAIRSALTDNGRFAFETRNPSARAWERWTPANAVEVADQTGAMVRIATRVEAAFDGRTVSFSHTFVRSGWSRPQVSHSTLRFVDAVELDALLAAAGFIVEERYGTWDRRPLVDPSPEIITIARCR